MNNKVLYCASHNANGHVFILFFLKFSVHLVKGTVIALSMAATKGETNSHTSENKISKLHPT